jgi:glycine/D-amino acid oxidase-like deaminating enzyme
MGDFDLDGFLEETRLAEAKEAEEAAERAKAEDEGGEGGEGLEDEKKAEEVEIVEGGSAGSGGAGGGGGGESNPTASKKAKAEGTEKGGSDMEWKKIEEGLGEQFKWVRNANAPGVEKTQIIATLEWSERHRLWCLWCKKFYSGPLSNIRAHGKNEHHKRREPTLVAGSEQAAKGAFFSSKVQSVPEKIDLEDLRGLFAASAARMVPKTNLHRLFYPESLYLQSASQLNKYGAGLTLGNTASAMERGVSLLMGRMKRDLEGNLVTFRGETFEEKRFVWIGADEASATTAGERVRPMVITLSSTITHRTMLVHLTSGRLSATLSSAATHPHFHTPQSRCTYPLQTTDRHQTSLFILFIYRIPIK